MALFFAVHILVHLAQKAVRRIQTGVKGGCSDGQSDLIGAAVLLDQPPDRAPNLLCQHPDLGLVPLADDDEFVPAVPRGDFLLGHRLRQRLPHLPQGCVPLGMTIAVVDGLEGIDVDHHAGKPAVDHHPLGQILQIPVQIFPVVQPGQRIQHGGFILEIDVQGGKAEGHRDPDQRQPVAQRLDQAADEDGGQKDHRRHKEIFPRFLPVEKHPSPAPEQVAEGHQIRQNRQRLPPVDVVRGDGEEDRVKQVQQRHPADDQPRHGQAGPQPRHPAKQLVFHIGHPKHPADRAAHIQHDVGRHRQGADRRTVHPVRKEGQRLHQAHPHPDQAEGEKQPVVQKRIADMLAVAQYQQERQRGAQAIGYKNSRQIMQCPRSFLSAPPGRRAGGWFPVRARREPSSMVARLLLILSHFFSQRKGAAALSAGKKSRTLPAENIFRPPGGRLWAGRAYLSKF